MMSAGEVTTIGLRDFKKADQAKVDRFIGRFGRDERIWHTTQHAICGYAYAKEKSRIVDVASVSDTEVDVTLALEADTFIPFCTAPMCLKLPADLPVKSARLGSTDCPVAAKDKGVYVDIPLQKAFAADCRMTLAKPESMTIPEEMPVTLTLRNTSGKPMSDVRLRWAGTVGTEVRGGDEKPFALAPDAERKVQAVVRTIRGPRRGVRPKGARFGLAPVTAIVTATVDGEQRVSAASWEVLVAPRLRVEMDPRGVPIGKGREFVFFVHLANGRVDTDRAWGDFHDEKLIDHRTGPCKGTVGFDLPDGMEAVPPTQPFDLPADGHATLRFVVRNRKWGDAQPVYVRPAIRFAGETDPIEVPWFGTRVMRDVESEGKPLDEKGLLAQASWDDRKNTRGNLDRAAGSTAQSCPGASGGGQTPCHEGVKKWCLGWNSNIAFDAWRNIDHRRGTVMFWWRRDSRVRNDIRTRPDRAESWKVPGRSKNHGEKLFCAGIHRDLILRRYPKHRQREGYLELVLREMPVRGRPTKVHYVQADFETARLYDWRHVAIVWDLKARRLELYLDGELAGRAEKGEEEWLVMPFDRGRKTHGVVLVETHHGHWSGSNRDEFYIYNRPLTPEEIRANMALAKR